MSAKRQKRQNISFNEVLRNQPNTKNINEILPKEMINMIGEYSGTICHELTSTSQSCLYDQNQNYDSKDYGVVNCTDYCRSDWQNWLLPILITLAFDQTVIKYQPNNTLFDAIYTNYAMHFWMETYPYKFDVIIY